MTLIDRLQTPALRTLFSLLLFGLLVVDLLLISSTLVTLLDADTLYPAGIYHNLFNEGYSLSSEAYNDHPGFFPDCLVYWSLLSVFSVGPSTALYAFIWYAVLILLSYAILREVGLERSYAVLAALTAGLWQDRILWHPRFVQGQESQILKLLYPHSHSTAILLGLLLALVAVKCRTSIRRRVAAAVLVIPFCLAVVSDKIVLAHILAPFCLTLVLLSWGKGRNWGVAIWVAFSALVSLLGIVLLRFLPDLGLGHLDGIYSLSEVSSASLSLPYDVMSLLVSAPVLGLAVLLWLVGAGTSLAKARREPEQAKYESYLFFQTFVLSVAFASLAAAAVTGFWSGLLTLRYIYPFLVLGPFGVVLALSAFPRWRTLLAPLAVIVLLGSAPGVLSSLRTFELQSLQTPYPEDIACLDRLAQELHLTEGYSEYWGARRANLFSRAGVRVTPVEGDNGYVPYSMSLNLDSVTPPGEVQFILTDKLDEERLRRDFGPPSQIVDCGALRIFVVDPEQNPMAKASEPGSLLHVGMLRLGEGATREPGTLAISSPGSVVDPGIVAFGPYIKLREGNYVLALTLSIGSSSQEGNLVCEVVSQRGRLTHREVPVGKGAPAEQSLELELPFAVTPALTTDKFEFRVWKAGPYALTVESAELHPQRR